MGCVLLPCCEIGCSIGPGEGVCAGFGFSFCSDAGESCSCHPGGELFLPLAFGGGVRSFGGFCFCAGPGFFTEAFFFLGASDGFLPDAEFDVGRVFGVSCWSLGLVFFYSCDSIACCFVC